MSDFYRPFQLYFRRHRMKRFAELFKPGERTRIIDVGGYEFNWTLIDVKPHVLLVNLEDEHWRKGQFTKIKGDGRHLDFADHSFDIAYSNSVIEHVGTRADQVAFAKEVRRVAKRYYVQTPNRNFFVEPHLIAPFIHLLPYPLTRKLVRRFSVWGWVQKPCQATVDEFLGSIRLLDRHEMQRLFPDAEILEETFMGMTKSLIAVRR